MNNEQEFFIRELTRKLDEQINSIRRELDNLKRLGLLKTKNKNRKKYYCVNKNFIFLEELKSIFVKALSSNETIARELEKVGNIKVLALSGVFIDQATQTVDMLIVGDIDKDKLTNYLANGLRTQRAVKFTIMNERDYLYRVNCKDKFVTDLIKNSQNQVLINKLA